MRVVLIFVLIFFNGMRSQESARIYRVKKFQKQKETPCFKQNKTFQVQNTMVRPMRFERTAFRVGV